MAARKSSGANPTWAQKRTPTRGPKPSHSADQIARAAILLADAEGLAALTMQRLARELGLTTMALYRYFPGKAHIIAAMIDAAADPPPGFGGQSRSWTTRLREWARRCLLVYQEHPWFMEATTARQSPMGPNELSWMEAALAMLAESGLGPKERHYAFLAIIGHVRGHATFQQVGRNSGAGMRQRRELAQTLEPEVHRYPMLLDALGSGMFGERAEGAFDFGLTCILDGICARVARRSR